ncbi:hypothetical protein Vretimale_19667 [Volvox reticuliferus]|uniref:Uncharacterized protein n=1 Tax=Volvox reticuliferus TaxID=1737510 RepID=A0A8J4FXJ3_9CHLO|nr:hypothetical protein Vretifemale_20682 [Volvox reticuliferus]GIM17145.1 hypothetical protein Vretimale_19667 [Volvox reticuliferus]
MFISGPHYLGARIKPQKTFPLPVVARLHIIPSAPSAQAWLCRRRAKLITVAAQRPPVNRNLLDNVDITDPDGYSIYVNPLYGGPGGEVQTAAGNWSGGAGPTTQPSEQAGPSYADADTASGDWPYDPQTLPTSSSRFQQQQRQQQQQPADSLRATASERSPSSYNGSGYAYTFGPQSLKDVPITSNLDQPPSPVNAAPSAWVDERQVPPQGVQPTWQSAPPLPGANGPRATTGVDWGEIDPLLDWGGVANTETRAWNEQYSSHGSAAPPSPSSNATENVGPVPEADPCSRTGTRDAYGAWAADGGGATATRGPSADWSQEGPECSAGGPGDPPPFGGWAGTWTSQEERYGTVPTGSAAYGAAGMGGTSPPPDAIRPSDVILLPGRDASAVLPLAPMSAQVDFFQPRTLQERIVQFIGSVGTSVILSKAAVLAGPALLYPIWSPWIRAGLRNLDLYSKTFACVGLWRAQVLDVQINGLAIGGMLISKQPPVVALLVGDPWRGGARVALELPYQLRSETIRVGDTVEMLVLSRDDRFTSFKVVREVYLPQSGLWLYDYPYVNRDLFVAVSVAVERQRQAEAAAAMAAQYYAYDIPAGAEMGPTQSATPGPA